MRASPNKRGRHARRDGDSPRKHQRKAFRPASPYLAIKPEAFGFDWCCGASPPTDRTEDGVAIVSIFGPLEHHAGWWFDSYEAIVQRVEDAITGDDVVKAHERSNWWRSGYEPIAPLPARAVVMRIDSPGGDAAGATAAHRRLRQLRREYDIPLYAYADEMACSAGYEIACAADEIWMPDTGQVGSIGVIATLLDRTKGNDRWGTLVELITSGDCKADSHADRLLNDDIRARAQAHVDQLADVFFRVVARARGTTPAAIAALQAAVFIGADAVDVGIADGIARWGEFLATVTETLNETSKLSAASSAA